jgi:DNA-binding MarR family transcriptional regulator/N-acetylglutamate synthase-like GNAT family acetyltransferase
MNTLAAMAGPSRAVDVADSHSADLVQGVRRFNRFYTRQIGVLHEHLLKSRFSLTEVRVLYELAHRAGVTAGDLRRDLGIDRGYLSRLLHGFGQHGWIKTSRSPSDRRKVLLSLTGRGRRVFGPLDRRSSEEVRAMVARLSPSQQKGVLGAMREIEAALNPAPRTAAPYTLRQHQSGDMGWVVHRHGILYAQEYGYDERFEALVAGIVSEFIQHFNLTRERCWIAERDGEIVGSVFLVQKSKSVAKLRLLLVEPGARGLGIGQRLVSECVSLARQIGYRKMVLWTQSELHAARHLYERAGFKRVAQTPHQSWGRDDLVAETWELAL